MPLSNFLKNLFKKEEVTNPLVVNDQLEQSRARLQQSVVNLEQQRTNLVKQINKTKINLENAKRVRHKASIIRNKARIRTYQSRQKQLSDQISALESQIKNFNSPTLHSDNIVESPLSHSTPNIYRKLIVSDDDSDNEKLGEPQDEDNNHTETSSGQFLKTDTLNGNSKAALSPITIQNRFNLDKANPISRQPQLINDVQSSEKEIVLPVCKTNATIHVKTTPNSKTPECKFSIPNRDLKSNSQLTIMAMVAIALRSGHFNKCFVIRGNERTSKEALKALYTLDPDYTGRVLRVINNQTKDYSASYINDIKNSIQQDKQLVRYKNEIMEDMELSDEADELAEPDNMSVSL